MLSASSASLGMAVYSLQMYTDCMACVHAFFLNLTGLNLAFLIPEIGNKWSIDL